MMQVPKDSIAYFNAAIRVFTLVVLSIPISTHAAARRTTADDTAFAENIKARAEMDFIHKVFEEEMHRLTSNSDAPPSPDVAKLFDTTVKHPALSDTSVSLHFRLIERERLTFVSGIQMIKASLQGHCGEPTSDLSKFGDPLVRQQELQGIQCLRTRRDLYQRGTHREGLAREKSILELKLPPYTREDMLTRQRAWNSSQDVEIAATYKSYEAADVAVEQLIKFLDSHSQNIRVISDTLIFANEADAATFSDLQKNVAKMQKQIDQ
jgi:hypothetical protein